MKKKKKLYLGRRSLAILLALVMCFGSFSATAFAEGNEDFETTVTEADVNTDANSNDDSNDDSDVAPDADDDSNGDSDVASDADDDSNDDSDMDPDADDDSNGDSDVDPDADDDLNGDSDVAPDADDDSNGDSDVDPDADDDSNGDSDVAPDAGDDSNENADVDAETLITEEMSVLDEIGPEEEEAPTAELEAADTAMMNGTDSAPAALRARAAGPNLGGVVMDVGETASHWSWPRLGFYCNYDGTLISYAEMYQYGDCYGGAEDSGIVKVTGQGYDGGREQYIKTTLEGIKGGVTTFEISTRVKMYKSGVAQCSNCGTRWRTDVNRWVDYSDSWTVTVYDTFTMTFDANGGKFSDGNPQKQVEKREAVGECSFSNDAPTPTKDGYIFKGWSDTPNGEALTNITIESTSAEDRRTVYAIWEKDAPTTEYYTVNYTDGVAGETVFPDQGYEGLVEGEATPSFDGADPTRTGFTFTGWKLTTGDGKPENPTNGVADKVYADDADGSRTIIYEAQWKENAPTKEYYTVIYKDGDGGKVFTDESYGSLEEESATPSFKGNPTRDGFTFTGWKLTTGDGKPENPTNGVADKVYADDADGSRTIIYEAQWKENAPTKEYYTVIYKDGDGGKVFTDESYESLEEESATPSFKGNLTRDGFTFTGWKLTTGDVTPANPTNGVADKVYADDADGSRTIIYEAQWEEEDEPGEDPGASPTPTPSTNPDPTPSSNPDPSPSTNPDPTPSSNPDPSPSTNPDPTPSPNPGRRNETPQDPAGNEPNTEITVGFTAPAAPLVNRVIELIEIPNTDIPMAGVPGMAAAAPKKVLEGVDIFDEEVPLANVPQTGDDFLIWLFFALGSAAGLALLALKGGKHKGTAV